MRSNSKHPVDELERYIQMYLDEGWSYRKLSEEKGLLLSETAFNTKVLRYQEHGLTGIQTKRRNNHYSKEFKDSIVKEYVERGTPVRELARKYNIPAHETVRKWIIKYTKGEGLKTYSPKPEVYTMKSRKVTHDEKIKIVKACLANNLSYKEVAEKYRVSYNNVYSWVQKYKEHGPDGLIDGRGRGKPDKIQTDEEKLRTEIAALKARNEYLETENAALKKLEEVERELMLRKRDMRQSTKPLKSLKNKDSK
ncbi:helix-turn-helix domain-containing protein [Pseudogracilibacillus auburnensis]|uniref:helix-turn-helix domain-containing protein n=2 Tax=Pseudogracilibacillus auburnensis TaxID=1494959 RepID=UPI001A95C0EB|nr:helix-turn-helix domain-containing protein [Pseudogracilibacillus auburnensis]MBO1002448.1 helix-turn-helix domain-containing protein [Pseudogracilibacillus auburnensis]